MVKAVWNGAVVAEADETVIVEGNHYFPRGGVAREFPRPSQTTSVRPWKRVAHYYTLVVRAPPGISPSRNRRQS